MGEGLSHWSSMVLRKSQTCFFDRHTHPNSMYSNFCHVLKNEIKLLYQLRYIKNYLNRGGKINDKLKRLFEKNDLYIKLRGDIYQMMRN